MGDCCHRTDIRTRRTVSVRLQNQLRSTSAGTPEKTDRTHSRLDQVRGQEGQEAELARQARRSFMWWSALDASCGELTHPFLFLCGAGCRLTGDKRNLCSLTLHPVPTSAAAAYGALLTQNRRGRKPIVPLVEMVKSLHSETQTNKKQARQGSECSACHFSIQYQTVLYFVRGHCEGSL
jgi:hypothetical protein